VSGLIDTTEMYLRTIWELLEEAVAPLRARIAERLQQSGPTVSQTVSRMERDGLLAVHSDRRILLTPEGERLAMDVMRRHRLAERLLVDVVGLEWPLIHEEACRWEHVIGPTVEVKLVALLAQPDETPYGTPIPQLGDRVDQALARFQAGVVSLASVLAPAAGPRAVTVRRIGEYLQADADSLTALDSAAIHPGQRVEAECDQTRLWLRQNGQTCELDADWAEQIFVAQ
jgi:DtxR family Mn-dependent transcriptional regulator